MIHYSLRCAAGHEFEGWFQGSSAFERQAEGGLLSCPRCGTTEVSRGLMAPAVRTVAARPVVVPEVATAKREVAATPALPDELRTALQRIRAEVERTCDDVGDAFADQAIRMSRGEIAERGIYGNATDADREVLADEGVSITRIPWLKRMES